LAKSPWTAERGFSLLEVLMATTILTVGLAALAQLFAISTRANFSARSTTTAAILAQQKMEQLRGLTWGFDTLGLPVSDYASDTTVIPEAPTGGKGLSPSPPDALKSNQDGYCDFLNRYGYSLGGGATPPTGAVYIRRWSVEPIPTNPNNTLVLQVLVTQVRDRGSDSSTNTRRLPDEARITSVKTRKAH
jgi:prepilin-type N-terminal cleavage/methylation domain-containing protein